MTAFAIALDGIGEVEEYSQSGGVYATALIVYHFGIA